MSRVDVERQARLEILVDRVYQLGLAAGLQCRLRVAEFDYPQGCANPAACHPDARELRAEQLRPRGQCFTNMLMLYWRSRSVSQLSALPHPMRGTQK